MQGTLVISYDRLITKTPNVDYYATFDNFGVGVIQGTQLLEGLGLKPGEKAPAGVGPFNVELFGGSPDDTNAGYFYNGAMSVIQPFIDDGTIVIQSGQTGMDKVGTLRWLAATAQARMDNLLSAYYTDKKVDGVLSPYDGLSIGILSSLKGVGYCTPELSRALSSLARMQKLPPSNRSSPANRPTPCSRTPANWRRRLPRWSNRL